MAHISSENKKIKSVTDFILVGIAGLEPAKCRSQSPVPYRLGYIPLYELNGVGNRIRTDDPQSHNLVL